MVRLKDKKDFQLLFCFIPLITSVVFSINQKIIFLILTLILPFIIIGVLPVFRRRENLWMFLIVSFAGTPINILISYFLVSLELFYTEFFMCDILWGILVFFIMFSLEQIVFGIVTRMIYKRQKPIFNGLVLFSEMI